ncbi:hypothetical protein BJY00DRAFT_308523 [Aspergillus carlsbadensis]|nr:hypothetical protein BJY00DRAFT_308523 [Aspergillus carlsbadensis]
MATSNSPKTPSIAFQNALDKFASSLTKKQKLEFAVTKYEDVEDAIERIQQQYGEKKELQNMYRIQSFLEAMNEYGKVVEVFLNCTPFVAYIWGPVKFVLQVASSWSDSLDILLGAYEDIGERAPSFLRHRLLFERNPSMRDILEKWYCDVLQFHFHALQFLTRPKWKQLFKSSWKVFNSNFKRILDSLQRHKDIIESEKSTLTVYEIQTLRDDEAARFNETRLDSILNKINAPNCYLDQETVSEHRENSQSGKWVLDHEKFKQWHDAPAGSNPLLYVHGIPGAGKTTLASVIIETLCAAQQSPTLYFYCRHRQEGKDSFVGILRGLLAQILSVDQVLATFFSEKYSGYDRRRFETANVVKEAADVAFSSQCISYVVLDGLDECDPSEAEKVISWFTSRQQQAPLGNDGHIRLLCLGQRTELLQRMLSGAQDISLDTQQRHKEDIECYIRGKIHSISANFGLDSDTQNNITSRVSTVANGMFLYAKVVTDNLACQYTLDQLMEELAPGVFPDGLDDAYQRVVSTVINKAPPKQRRAALQILGWVTCATRPLKWREIQATFFIDPETSTSQYEGRRLRATCKKFCSSLVDLHVGTTGESTEATLGLVHSTAREYLINTDTIDFVAQNVSLALFCSQYLLSDPFSKTIDDSKIQEYAHSGYYALQDYAVSSIFDHFHAAFEKNMGNKQVLSDELHSSLQLFISGYGKAFRLTEMSTADTFSAPHKLYQQLPSDPVKIYALFDLERRTSLIRSVLEGVRNDDSLQQERKMTLKAVYGPESYKCSRPWCVHFQNGLDTVEHRKRHIHRHDNPFVCPEEQCPLHQIGFDTEANLDRHITQYHSSNQGNCQTTFPQPRPTRQDTLCAAAERGDFDLVQKHIDNGANVNEATRSKGARTPLYLAAQNGHLAICDLLMRHGADIHYGFGSWRLHALTTAIKNGNDDIVRYLLDKSISLQGRPTALECATGFGRLEIVKCIIAKFGCRLEPYELGYALWIASERGNVELAILIIELVQSRSTEELSATVNWQGDVSHRSRSGQVIPSLTQPVRWQNGKAPIKIATIHTPLHAAARNGHYDLVQLLLRMKANPSPAYLLSPEKLADLTWATPLFDAARNGHTEVVRLLLEAVADPNEPCGWVAPLHIAFQNGHTGTVQLLLESGKVLIDATSLFKATVRGNVSIPALHALALTKNAKPLAAIKVGTIQLRNNEDTSKWYRFSNPQMQKLIEVDLLQSLDFGHSISCITFSEDDKYLAVCTDDTIVVYDAMSGQQIGGVEVSMNKQGRPHLQDLCFSPDSNHLIGRVGESNLLWSWDISTTVSYSLVTRHSGPINVIYTRDGRSVVTGGRDGYIRVWDVSDDGHPIHVCSHDLELDDGVTSLAISPDGHYLVIGSIIGGITLWDLKTRTTSMISLGSALSYKGSIDYISFSLDGRHLVCHEYGRSIRSWEWIPGSAPDGQPSLGKATTPGGDEVEGIPGGCVTADERWLLSRQPVGKIIIQDAVNGLVQAVLQAHTGNVGSLICSSAGYMFATVSYHRVRIWKMSEI